MVSGAPKMRTFVQISSLASIAQDDEGLISLS